MRLEEIEAHLTAAPIDGVTWRVEEGWIHLSVGPIWARATIDDDGDGFVAVFDDKGMRGFGESFFEAADIGANLRTVCAAYLRRSEQPDPFDVRTQMTAIKAPGLYAELLREHFTQLRLNLHKILGD